MSRKASLHISSDSSNIWTRPLILGGLLGLLACLLYANTLNHDYVLDDEIVITDNAYTQQGAAGLPGIFSSDPINVYFEQEKNLVQGGRYRPLSIATFALEVELFGENPFISHLLNALLYGGSIWILFILLLQMRPPPSSRPFFASSAFLIALLFAVHPIHTEVVANIKGRDEILALFFGLLTFSLAFRYYDKGSILHLLLLPVTFFLALLSKESALPLLLPIPLAFWFFRKIDWTKTLLTAGILLGTTIAYLMIRISLVGPPGGSESSELMNNPFVGMSFGERLAICFHSLALYLQKLTVPYPLSYDYYPWAFGPTGWGDAGALVGLVLHIGLIGLGVVGLWRKKAFAFGIIFYLATLSIVSNIPFSVGTLMAERLVYIPSLGFLMALVWGIEALVPKEKATVLGYAGMGIALVFAGMTFLRNPVWQDNYTLFTTDVYHVPHSAKARNSAGGALNDHAKELPAGPEQTRLYQESERHLVEAVRIHPTYAQAWLLLGNARYGLGRSKDALSAFEQAISLKPNFEDAVNNAAVVAADAKLYGQSAAYYRSLLRFRPGDPEVWFSRGLNFERAGQPDSAIFAYQGAIRIDAQHWRAMGNMSLVLGRMKNDFANATRYGEQALAIHQDAEWLYDNTAIAYAMGGNPEQAAATFQRGLLKFPNSAKLNLNLGMTFLNLGRRVEAIPVLQKAASLDPNLQAQVQTLLSQ